MDRVVDSVLPLDKEGLLEQPIVVVVVVAPVVGPDREVLCIC